MGKATDAVVKNREYSFRGGVKIPGSAAIECTAGTTDGYTQISKDGIEVVDVSGAYYVDIAPGVIEVNDDDDEFSVKIDGANCRITLSDGGEETRYMGGGIYFGGGILNFPTGPGTFALTSDIPSALSGLADDVVSGHYLPLTGGTITGGGNSEVILSNDSVIVSNGGTGTQIQTVSIGPSSMAVRAGSQYTYYYRTSIQRIEPGQNPYNINLPSASGTIALTSDITAALGDIETLLAAI